MASIHTLDTTLHLGRGLDLEVPISVEFEYRSGSTGTYWQPAESHTAEVVHAEREDGMAWHSGCQDALNEWWDLEGEQEAIASARDELDAQAEDAAERRAEWRQERDYA